MRLPDFNTWSTKMQAEKYLMVHYPLFLEELNKLYPFISSLKEKIYLYRNKLIEPKRCKVCGKYTKYDGPTKGYRIYCSAKCSNSDPDKLSQTQNIIRKKYGVDNISKLQKVKEKKISTLLLHYGVENPSYLESVKQKRKQTCLERYGNEHYNNTEKFKQTCLKRYGVEHISQLEEIKNRKKETYLKKYGVEHISQLEEIKNRKKETYLKKYGVEHPMYNSNFKEKIKKSFNEHYKKSHPDIIDIFENNGERMYKCKCCDLQCTLCNEKYYTIHSSLYHSRNYHNLNKCTIKNPIDLKSKNTSLEIFVKNILEKYNIEYIENKRLYENLEVDIYLPLKQIAIECNGIYWHSDQIKIPKYHYNKYKIYEEHGIQLLTIWEDWIKNKPEIVESIILSKLGIYNQKIYGRKCIIKNVDYIESKNFLEKNHIQGNANSSIRLGLYFEDTLQSIMCFSKTRKNMMGKNNSEDWELVRFCNKVNSQIIGGASKLFQYFLKQYNPKNVISFASQDISNGSLYEILGFDKIRSIFGSYWYIDNRTLLRYHRYCFRKSELIKKGYDEKLSEFQIMNNLPYYRIYDAGQIKYIYYNS